jgi:hypothetical protein
MGKITSNSNPRRMSHPPHMPRYRMASRDRVTKALNALRHKLGASIFRGSDLRPASAPGWFQKRRALKKAVAKMSLNRLVLIDNGYRDETQRHWFHHRDCGNNLFLSPDHIMQQGSDHVCVYCQGATDMQACGTTNLLQSFVYERSDQRVITIQRQDLRSNEDEYAFYCVIHRESYFTSFKHFLDTAGISNGCPLCAGETSYWDEASDSVNSEKP